ncbi:MAG: hypothetical protein JWQ54_598 [Mucilaginibacter sp.]|nr:hypothetical protein [Mucilaginibacter sp.]
MTFSAFFKTGTLIALYYMQGYPSKKRNDEI